MVWIIQIQCALDFDFKKVMFLQELERKTEEREKGGCRSSEEKVKVRVKRVGGGMGMSYL